MGGESQIKVNHFDTLCKSMEEMVSVLAETNNRLDLLDHKVSELTQKIEQEVQDKKNLEKKIELLENKLIENDSNVVKMEDYVDVDIEDGNNYTTIKKPFDYLKTKIENIMGKTNDTEMSTITYNEEFDEISCSENRIKIEILQ